MNRSSLILRDIARSQALRSAHSVAYIYLGDDEAEEARLTFSELDRKARARAAWLQRNAKPGDRAVLAYPAGVEFIVTFLACAYARLIPVSVAVPGRSQSRDASWRRLMAVLADCSPRLLLSVASMGGQLPTTGGQWQFPEEACQLRAEDFQADESGDSADDVAFLQYTSGSTESPRGVAVTHRALHAQLEYHQQRARQTAEETIFAGWLPHHHDFGLVGFHLSALYMGSLEVFMSPAAFLHKPSRWLEMISRYRATYSGGPNFGYELCANSKSALSSQALDLRSWAIASVGGESACPATLQKFSAAFERFGFRQDVFLPAYGLAESVLCVAARQGLKVRAFDRAELQQNHVVPANSSSRDGVELVAHGQPFEGHCLRIVDPESREALPPNRVGEIWLQGDSVARGYWHDEERTRSLFQATIAGTDNEPHLRTGDYGFIFDGDLYVTGRLKDVIIVRGNNHSPDDLEGTIQSAHAALRPGCGAVFQLPDSPEPKLVAVQEVNRGASSAIHEQIFSSIVQVVAEHHGLRLNAIVLINANSIPRTTSGKVCRHECKELFLASKLHAISRWDDSVPGADEQPRGDDIEASLLSHLHALLPHAHIGVDDNIFSHGCDSLTTQRYLARIRDSFQVALPTQTLFVAPTVSALSRHVRQMIPSWASNDRARGERIIEAPLQPLASASSSDPLSRLEELGSAILHELRSLRELIEQRGAVPAPAKPSKESAIEEGWTRGPRVERELTSTQREIRLLEELHPEISPAFTRISVLQLWQPLDKDTAYRAFREVSNRHDALRIVVEARNQRVLPYVDPDIRCVSLSHVNDVPAWLREERQRKFDPGRAPLWRVHLLTTEKDPLSLLVITAHALIADSWSLSVVAKEFVQLWRALSEGKPCDLPQSRQFGELCEMESDRRDEAEFRKHRDYWIERIGSQPAPLAFPSDEPRRLDATYEAGWHGIVCDGDLRVALTQQGGKKSLTLFQTLLSAYFVLLHRYTGQDRFMIGVESSARGCQSEDEREDAGSAIGCCSKLVPVVIDFSDPQTGADILKAVRDETVSSIEHQDYTLSMLAEDLRIPFDPKQPVRIPATISMCSPLRTDACVARFDLADISVTHSPFALTLDVRDLGTSLRLDFTYQKAILGTGIERLAAWYLRILEAIAKDASVNLFEVQILDDEEKRRILAWSAGEPEPVEANATFQGQFETQAARSAGGVAATCGNTQITYDELNRDANKLVWRLAESVELQSGAAVGILCSRGCDYLTAVVGTLKAGLVCLPLDPGLSPLQARQKLKHAAVRAIWFSEEFRELAEAFGIGLANCRMLCIQEATATETARQENPPVGADADSRVFLIDSPEERSELALIGHRGMLNHLHAKIRTLKMTANDVVCQSANQCDHISIWQFLAPLLSGATVRVLDEETTQNASRLLVALAENGVTIVQARPYIVRDVLEIAGAGGARPHSLKTLRWLVSTGEALPADVSRRWISCFPRTKILNCFSSPHCSDALTHHVVVWPPPPSATRVPIGRPIPGAQIYVLDRRGQLAPAGTPGELYVGGCCLAPGNRGEMRGSCGSRFERTGALVRFRNDGTLDYLGDVRRPLAVGGWRIEPGEVESALRRSPAVLDAAVTVKATEKGEPILVAYVSLRKTPPTSAGILRALVRNVLPQALVPSVVVFVERLPRTSTGEIAWDSLPEPELAARLDQPTPPSTPIEEELARIWREELNVSSVGVLDDLFELGGNSLAATRIATRIGATFNFRIPVSAIFHAPTVAGTALYVEQQLASSPSTRWQPVLQTTH